MISGRRFEWFNVQVGGSPDTKKAIWTLSAAVRRCSQRKQHLRNTHIFSYSLTAFRSYLFYLQISQTYYSTSRFATLIFFITWWVVDRRGLFLA